MKNPTAEDVLKKTFDHLNEVIGETSKDSGAVNEQHSDTIKKRKQEEETTQNITEDEPEDISLRR